MIRIFQIGAIFRHECVKCGEIVQYGQYGAASCRTCKSPQRLKSKGSGTSWTSVPLRFLMDEDSDWRLWYHSFPVEFDIGGKL